MVGRSWACSRQDFLSDGCITGVSVCARACKDAAAGKCEAGLAASKPSMGTDLSFSSSHCDPIIDVCCRHIFVYADYMCILYYCS